MAEQTKPALPKRKLTATSTQKVTGGTNDKGRDWTLWQVHAVDEAGAPVEKELKSFAECPIGELVEYEIERQYHEKYGESFLIKPPKKRLSDTVDELRKRIERLESRVEELAGSSTSASSSTTSAPPTQRPQSAPSPNGPPAGGPAGGPPSDDDIPF